MNITDQDREEIRIMAAIAGEVWVELAKIAPVLNPHNYTATDIGVFLARVVETASAKVAE